MLDDEQRQALAGFQFKLRGTKRPNDNGGVTAGVSDPKVIKLVPKNLEDELCKEIGIGLFAPSSDSGNLTILGASSSQVARLANSGLMNVKYVTKTPDGKKLSVGNAQNSSQVVASSSLPENVVNGYLSGFPIPATKNDATSSSGTEKSAKKKHKPKRKVCAVPTCNDPQDKHYFMFPQKNARQKLAWIQVVRRADKNFNPKNAFICEEHFSTDMIQRDLQAELLGLQRKKKLVEGAIPTINVPGRVRESIEPSETTDATPNPVTAPIAEDVDVDNAEKRKLPKNFTNNCAVKSCKNPSDKDYFSFPSNPDVRKIWIKKCDRDETYFNANKRKVCAIHFAEDDFEIDMKSRLLYDQEVKKLKEGAIPSLHLGKISAEIEDDPIMPDDPGVDEVNVSDLLTATHFEDEGEMSARDKRQKAKDRKKSVDEIIMEDTLNSNKSLEKRVQQLKDENDI